MFRRLPDPAGTIAFDFEGRTFEARDGDSVAAALLANGVLVFRTTPVSGAPRGPWCLIGNCHECLVEIDGEPNRQACMVEARREDVGAPLELGVLHDGVTEIVRAHCVIIASGAQERAVPVQGATLPGVMGAGGAQSLLKGAGLVPDVPVVIAGSGPLVYLVAWQLVRAGAPVRAVLITMPSGWMSRAGGTLPEALAMPAALFQGIGWRRALAARGVEVMQVSDLAIEGRNRVESLRFRHRGRERSMQASLVLLHEGVIPNAHLTLAARLDHAWDPRQHAFRPAVDEWGRTSEPGVLVAGDGARILGAEAAVATGRIAALEAVYRLGKIQAHQRDALARSHRVSLARHRRFREFLDLTFEPVPAVRRPTDTAVTVCRCEEVTVAEIERVIGHGCQGPNQAKAFTRCGMGPCQGRMCATVVSELFAEHRHVGVGAVGHYRIRPPVKPVTVGELAGLEGTGSGPADRPSTPISALAKSSEPVVEHLLAIPDAGDDTDFDRDASGFRPVHCAEVTSRCDHQRAWLHIRGSCSRRLPEQGSRETIPADGSSI